MDGTDYYNVYAKDTIRRITRKVNPYTWSYTVYGTPAQCHEMASIARLDSLTVSLNSTTPLPQPITPPHRLLDVLQSWDNQSLWEHFTFDFDGTWIKLGPLRGSIIIVHDGSYMPKVHPWVCSVTFTILCTTTNQQATGKLLKSLKQRANIVVSSWVQCWSSKQPPPNRTPLSFCYSILWQYGSGDSLDGSSSCTGGETVTGRCPCIASQTNEGASTHHDYILQACQRASG